MTFLVSATRPGTSGGVLRDGALRDGDVVRSLLRVRRLKKSHPEKSKQQAFCEKRGSILRLRTLSTSCPIFGIKARLELLFFELLLSRALRPFRSCVAEIEGLVDFHRCKACDFELRDNKTRRHRLTE